MAAKRTGLGRGIGALIPTNEQVDDRPSDVFFPRAVAVDEFTIVKARHPGRWISAIITIAVANCTQ